MDERKNNMLNQNKKREKQKKTHAKELENIQKYIEEVSSIFCGYSRVSRHTTLSYTDLADTLLYKNEFLIRKSSFGLLIKQVHA